MIRLHTAGVEYTNNATIKHVFSDSLQVNSNIISQIGEEWVPIITNLTQLTDNCVNHLSVLAADLAKASGDSDSLHHKAGKSERSAARAEAYFRLDMPFRRWLAKIEPTRTDIAEAEQEWKTTISRIFLQLGKEMTYQSGEKAMIGRWVKRRLYTAPGASENFRLKILRTIEKGG